MIETPTHVTVTATAEAPAAPRGRTRTCVGCAERVDVLGPAGADLIRLVLGADGAIAVDGRGGGSGRGAHVHARRPCLERAARSGLMRATKGNARRVLLADRGAGEAGEADKHEGLSADSLARAIQASMDRRIEGLLRAAVRSRSLARGIGRGRRGRCRSSSWPATRARTPTSRNYRAPWPKGAPWPGEAGRGWGRSLPPSPSWVDWAGRPVPQSLDASRVPTPPSPAPKG